MTIEEKLKDMILSRYKSLREFTQVADIPYTTLDSILKRGVANASISNVIKICKILNLSVDALADNRLEYRYDDRKDSEITDITDLINNVKTQLSTADSLVIDGKKIDIETVDPIIDALDIGFEMVRKKSNKNITKSVTKTTTKTEV